MYIRILITFSFWNFIAVTALYAQWSKEDSLKLQRLLQSEGEIKLNRDAIKSIQFGNSDVPKQFEQQQPRISEDKPYMNFRKDFNLPKHLQNQAVTAADSAYKAQKEHKRINENLRLRVTNSKDDTPRGLPVGMDPSIAPIPEGGNADFDGFLYGIFSKKGRMFKHNRKRAKAWKNY